MATLSKNWITEKLIDFEYKKYILLAYLQEVSRHFELNQLYPDLSELILHYHNTKSLKENKKQLFDAFPQQMKSIDVRHFFIQYEKLLEDDQLMKEIESIIDYSIPKFEHYLNEGRQIYDFIEKHLEIFPIGVIPLNTDYGYLLLKGGKRSDTNVFEYQITLFEKPGEKYRAIHTSFVRSYSSTFTNTFDFIKTDLIRENSKLPNPAAYAIETELDIPLHETFLPIAKRTLVRYVAAA
ncbi:MAG: hypothetical protein AB1458_02950 [Bacteroidota bacterium]